MYLKSTQMLYLLPARLPNSGNKISQFIIPSGFGNEYCIQKFLFSDLAASIVDYVPT